MQPRVLVLSVLAALGISSSFAGTARADVEEFDATPLVLLATAAGHALLAPGYASTFHYGVSTDERMPIGWAIGNFVAAAGALGFGGALAVAMAEELDRSRELGQRSGFVGGFSIAAGGLVVGLATTLQVTRPGKAPPSAMILPIVLEGPSRGTGVAWAGHF